MSPFTPALKNSNESDVSRSAEIVRNALGSQVEPIGIVLGSGLGTFAGEIQGSKSIPYSDIPGFPVSGVKGHSGKFVGGRLAGKDVIVMQGRAHFYEGFPMRQIAFPIRTMRKLGVKKLLLTNAAGAVNLNFSKGDLMLITDHINFSFHNPLIGENDDTIGVRFPDGSRVYDQKLNELAEKVAQKSGIKTQKGVYMFMPGPVYETPAEIRMARVLGADAVGMSTFPEALAAMHCGMQTMGISYISNMGAGINPGKLDHEEVLRMDESVYDSIRSLLAGIVAEL